MPACRTPSAESERQSVRFADHWSAFGFGLWALEADDRTGRAALEAAVTYLELEQVSAFIDAGKDASAAVAHRLGMSLDHIIASPDGPGLLLVWRIYAPRA